MAGRKKKVETEKEKLEDAIEAVVDTVESDEEPEYSSHRQQLSESAPSEARTTKLKTSLLEAFEHVISYEQVPVIRFGDLDVSELAAAFYKHPVIIKAVCSCVNVAQRALKRDLRIELDTYADRIEEVRAGILAGFLKPMLPDRIAVPALVELDRYAWTDKEMRAAKGRWEEAVRDAIGEATKVEFKKRKFQADGEDFEIDAAFPTSGPIEIAVDVKRIESPRDIHKRAAEIIDKAMKFRASHPDGKFFAIVYYPFPAEHINVTSRLKSDYIEGLFFAAQTASSIASAADYLAGMVTVKKNG